MRTLPRAITCYPEQVRGWSHLPRERLLADVSLWSADLGNLASAIRRLSPWADSFHLDAADAHFAPSLLFFPDLIRALRPHTAVPFHVHLMAEYPSQLAAEFLDAGADLLTVHVENGEREAGAAIELALRRGCGAGVTLQLATPVRAMLPYLDAVEAVILLGTELGVKGCCLAPQACGRLREARSLLREHARPAVRLVADGGIRANTVGELHAAGAATVVPGSLVFQSPDLDATFRWLRGHSVPTDT
jgi:ribulose-phosphate 3-epimerase